MTEPAQMPMGHSAPKLQTTSDPSLATRPPPRDRFFASLVPRDEALAACQQAALSPGADCGLRRAFLLTEIDHWNNNYEKVVLLAERSLVWVRYDFVTRRCKHWRRVGYESLTKVSVGDIQMPSTSAQRQHGAVRVEFGDPALASFVQRWNPFVADDIPFATFAHHPLRYSDSDPTYDVDEFLAELSALLRDNYPSVPIVQEPVRIDVMHGLASLVFNQSELGFCKDRNGASF